MLTEKSLCKKGLKSLKVRGINADRVHFHLKNGESLTSLPDKLTVHGSLTIRNCKLLKSLPRNLNVYKDFNIETCHLLSAISGPLIVYRNVWIKDCGPLAVSSDVKIKGKILALRNFEIKEVPPNTTIMSTKEKTEEPSFIQAILMLCKNFFTQLELK
ncbi:MAG: hypothetical protein AAF443_04620 [Chlamydiota bacterium]